MTVLASFLAVAGTTAHSQGLSYVQDDSKSAEWNDSIRSILSQDSSSVQRNFVLAAHFYNRALDTASTLDGVGSEDVGFPELFRTGDHIRELLDRASYHIGKYQSSGYKKVETLIMLRTIEFDRLALRQELHDTACATDLVEGSTTTTFDSLEVLLQELDALDKADERIDF